MLISSKKLNASVICAICGHVEMNVNSGLQVIV